MLAQCIETLLSRKITFGPWFKSWKNNLARVFFMTTRKNFFSVAISVQSGRKFQQTLKCTSLAKHHFFKKGNSYHTLCRMVMKNNPAKFRFPTLVQSGRKSLNPERSGTSSYTPAGFRNRLKQVFLIINWAHLRLKVYFSKLSIACRILLFSFFF